MEEYVQSLHIPTITIHITISSGYASFDSQKDQHIKDTMKRADEQMCIRKTEIKKRDAKQ